MPQSRIRKIPAHTVLLALCCLAVAGCYRRVVDADGPNASAYDVHEPSGRDNPIDRTIDDWLGSGENGRGKRR